MNIENDLNEEKVICSQNDMYKIGKIDQIISKNITNISDAPMGRWLVICQDFYVESLIPNDKEQNIWLFDSLNNTKKIVLHLKTDRGKGIFFSVNNIYWFGNSKAILIRVSVYKKDLRDRYEPPTSQFVLINVEKANIKTKYLPSKKFSTTRIVDCVNFIMFCDLKNKMPTVYFLDVNGNLSPVLKLNHYLVDLEIINIEYLGINNNLNQVVFHIKVKNIKNDKFSDKWIYVQVNNMTKILTDEKPIDDFFYKDKKKNHLFSLDICESVLTTKQGFSAKTKSIWLVSECQRLDKKFTNVLVTAQSNGIITDIYSDLQNEATNEWPYPIILNDMSAIFFTFDESLYVAPIIKINRKII